ncbi:MAG TPA: sodium:calcium antiporter [Acidimicrobiales bacterium]|jgi:cation:H+ antiporter
MLGYVVAVAVGLALLAFAPGRFVAGSAGLADVFGVPRVLVGALIIGFGTSAPEMLVSGLAAAQGEPEVGIGNIVGSNVANLSLILGIAALVGTMPVPRGLVRSELPLLAAATIGFAIAVQDGLSRAEGGALAVGLVVALVIVIRRAGRADPAEAEYDHEIDDYLAEEEAGGRGRLAFDAVAGLVGTIAGAQILVTGAVGIADKAGLSGGFVGMTLVALGTSLPELVTAVAAARAGEPTLILGNLIGSNLFNCLGVGAVVGLADAGPVDQGSLTGGVLLMLAVTAIAALSLARGSHVTRPEALGLLATYAVALPLLAL